MSKSNKAPKLISLRVPHQYRQDLSIPQGTLIVNPERGIVSGLCADIAVGDLVSERHHTRIKVVDHKTKRNERSSEAECQGPCIFVINPPGHLSLNSVTFATCTKSGRICVIGEEDLLVIPFLAQDQKIIIYGQPDVGVVLVRSHVEMALKVLKILKPTTLQCNLRNLVTHQ